MSRMYHESLPESSIFLPYFDPDFLAPYEGRGKSVRIEEGSQFQVQVDLIPDEEKKQ